MKPKWSVGVVFIVGFFCGSRHTLGQVAPELPTGADLLASTKYYAEQADTTDAKVQRNVEKLVTDSRHTFIMAPRDIQIDQHKYVGMLSVAKPAGSLKVLSSEKVEGRVNIKAETTLPLEQDLSFIDALYPTLTSRNTDSPNPKTDTRLRAYTTWYSIRFEGTKVENDAAVFAPLTKERFLAVYAKMCYVEIDSVPAGANLSVVGHDGWTETRDTGYLPEGDVTIILSRDGFKPTTAMERVRAHVTNNFRYTLERK